MKLLVKAVLLLPMLFANAYAAEPVKIRVAVLDNLQSQKYASEQYEKDYFAGVEAAIAEARTKGIEIEVKHFPYGKDSLDILKEVPKIKEWQADVVIGPRSSNKFLMLKDQFTDTLVLSPLSTASAVADLPENFYSLSLPNAYAVGGLVQVTRKLFPNRTVHKVIESDCKSCVDVGELFEKIFQTEKNISKPLTGTTFLNEQAEKINVSELLKDYSKDALILLPNTSYTSGVLMARISDSLKKDGVTFLGNDDWGTWKAGYIGKVKSSYKYQGIRILPWSLDVKTPILARCSQSFKKKFKAPLPDTISMLTCHTINVVSDLASSTLKDKSKTTKENILKAFLTCKSKDKNVFRSMKYAVHKVSQTGEQFLFSQKISLEKKQ